MTAGAAEPYNATQLHVPPGTPLLQVQRIATDFHGAPVELRIARVLTTERAYCNRLSSGAAV